MVVFDEGEGDVVVPLARPANEVVEEAATPEEAAARSVPGASVPLVLAASGLLAWRRSRRT